MLIHVDTSLCIASCNCGQTGLGLAGDSWVNNSDPSSDIRSGKTTGVSHLEILKTYENTYTCVYIYIHIYRTLLYPCETWWASLAILLVPVYNYKNWHVQFWIDAYLQDCVIYLQIYHNIPTKLVTCLTFEWYMLHTSLHNCWFLGCILLVKAWLWKHHPAILIPFRTY